MVIATAVIGDRPRLIDTSNPEINWDLMEFHAAKSVAGSVESFYGKQGVLGLRWWQLLEVI
jgi:hypothetical protein